MSISFTGNYLYSFKDQETAINFKKSINNSLKNMTRSNIDGSQRFWVSRDNSDVFVLTDKDYDNYQKAKDSIGNLSASNTTMAYLTHRLQEAYKDNAIKVDCKKDLPSNGLKFYTSI